MFAGTISTVAGVVRKIEFVRNLDHTAIEVPRRYAI